MKKIYPWLFSFFYCCNCIAQTKCDSLLIHGDLFLKRDVSRELSIVASHIDQDLQSHHDELWAYYLSKPHPSVATINRYFNEAAQEFDVPVQILKTIGQIENNWTQVGPSIDRGWGIMHLVQNNYCNTLHEAAQLLHLSDQVLKDDARQNIRGAAALLKKYYRSATPAIKRLRTKPWYEYMPAPHCGNGIMVRRVKFEDWYPAVKKFTGLISDELRTIQADRYYGVMIDGAHSTTLWNEEIVLPRNSNIDIAYIARHYKSNTPDYGSGSRSSDYGPAVSSMTTCNYGSGRSHSVDTWVNHWIGTGTAAGAVSWFQNCSSQVSAHFVTANNGTIYQVVPVANTAWHCGASGYPYNNSRSIGEEHEATNANPGLWNSTAMLQASANMACYFCSQFGIATNQNHVSPGICGHQNMPGTNTDCPGTIPWSTWFNYFNNGSCNAVVVTPPNDYCGNEVSLTVYGQTCGATTTGDLNGATQSTAAISCGGYTSTNANDIWFKFVATSTDHDITVVPSSGLDAVVDLRSGCPGTSVGCADVGGGEGATEVLHAAGLSIGNTYNVRVYDYSGASNPPTTTTFTICVTTPCISPVKPVVTGSHTICSGQTTMLTVSNTCGGCTYSWSNGGSGTSITVSSSGSYTVTATNSCATTVSDAYGVTVNPVVAPAVSISTANTTVCAGTSITFTATPTNGGSTPTYQWLKNGSNIGGATSSTYTSSALANNDAISVGITSNAACPSPASATSNVITMTVNPSVTPTVSISANPSGSICSGTNVTFTASITNGGASPLYTWKKNGLTVGGNSSSFSSSTLVNGDVIYCSLQSNISCPTANPVNSNSITMSVNSQVTPAVSIVANTSTSICTGQSVTFTATPTNGGGSPAYQWKLNGNDVATGVSYTNGSLSNGDVITCVLTSSLTTCITQATATSNALTMNISGSITPSISVSASSSNFCAGTNITFTATASGGGTAPVYQWKKNGADINGANGVTYSISTLVNGDVISCLLTSNAACANPASATSNAIAVTVNAPASPLITISSNATGAVCAGTAISFSSTISNGGASPVYQWTSNGSNINGANASSYSSTGLSNGEIISCVLTSNAACISPSTVNSNNIAVSISAPLTPAVTISSNHPNAVCAGTGITFTALAVNGGNSPTYQWKVNGVNSGSGNTFTTTSLDNGDIVTCELTSSLSCVTTATVTSNNLVANITTPVNPVLSITSNQGLVICSGTTVVFSSTAVNSGGAPVFQWKLNGANTITGSTYNTSALQNGDVVTCEMTSSLACVSNNGHAVSNTLQITVGGGITPTVQLNNCDLAASLIPNAAYQWYVNSAVIPAANTRFYTVNQSGYYYVVVADSIFCTEQSADVFVNYPACMPTGVQETAADLNFQVHELANSIWQVTVSDIFIGEEVEIFDAMGRSVLRSEIGVQKSELNVHGFSSGIYFVRVKNNDGKFGVQRMMKL